MLARESIKNGSLIKVLVLFFCERAVKLVIATLSWTCLSDV